MQRTEITFAAVPYVSLVDQPIRLGGYTLWPNTTDEWIARTGVDATRFLEMYRNHKGYPIGSNASVLTRDDLGNASVEDYRQIIVSLSTAAWLEDRAKAAADPWVFERWHVPTSELTANAHFLREGKFSINVTSAEHDRFYPTPYTHPVSVGGRHWSAVLKFLDVELKKPRGESIIVALSYFHLARFQTPYFTSTTDDIESLWSGFESMFDLKRRAAPTRLEGLMTWLSPRLRRCIDELLRSDHDQRDKTPKLLVERLRAEIAPQVPLSDDLWAEAENWAVQFYAVRNEHSHGERQPTQGLMVEQYGRSVYAAALIMLECILKLRALGDDLFLVGRLQPQLQYLFSAKMVVDSVVEMLRKSDRKEWYPRDGSTAQQNKVEALSTLLLALTQVPPGYVSRRGDPRVKDAQQKMGLVLSQWSKDLLATPPSGVELSPVATVDSTIRGKLKTTKDPAEIDYAVAFELTGRDAFVADGYGVTADAPPPSLLLCGKIPIWRWCDAYVKLVETFQGHPLRDS